MKRGVPWREPLPGSVCAWAFAALFGLFALMIARLTPALLIVPVLTVAVLFVKPFQLRRTPFLAGLLICFAVGFALPHDAAWIAVPTFGFCALALAAGEIAFGHGVGVPLGRFFGSRRIHGAAQLLFCVPYVAFVGIEGVARDLRGSALPEVWRWSVVPLALLAITPARWVGGAIRCAWAFPLIVAALAHWTARPRERPAELVFEAAMGAVWTLAMAGYAHEGLAKLLHKPWASEELPPQPVRIHTGEGMP